MYFKLTILTFSVTLLLKSVVCAPGQVSFIVASTESSTTTKKVDEVTKNDLPIIYEMDITSNVSNRFAKTLIHSKVKNAETSAKEATFSVVLPEQAFISKFVMEIGGKSYEAYVKGKEEAKHIYDKAVSSGQSAAHVAVNARHSNRFTVSINIEAEAKAAFLLTYEELLERKNNQYELILNIHPGQIVKDLNVQVNINETRSLVFVKIPSLRSGNEISKNDDKITHSSTIEMKETSAVVKFHPDADQQKEFAKHLGQKESEGLAGQFIVQYEVERDPNGGEVLLQDGYFVHFFAPKDVEPLPKNVYFILDTSGSMWGLKMKNLKDAMTSILGEIKPEDTLSIIEFNTETFVYNIEAETTVKVHFNNYEEPFGELSENEMPGPVAATKEIIEKAKKLVSNMTETGTTYIIGGLEAGLYLAKREIEKTSSLDTKRQPIIIFLTDGQPNVGIYETDKITKLVTHLNKDKINVPIFSLSFGEGADKGFLRKLSLKNLGFSRHIYDAADASLQLQDFYKQISSPLLSNVNFKYDSEVKEVTKTNYPIFFEGSEIIVAGCYEDPKFIAKVDALGLKGPVILRPKIETPVTSLERLWAYLTVKEILEKREAADNQTELTKKALDLAIKYSFVTDVSSLVVVKPNATDSVNTEDASTRVGESSNSGPLQLSNQNYDDDDDLDMDLIAPVPSPYQTSTITPSSTQQSSKVENSLPWLTTVLSVNRTITLPEGVYELGEWSLNINTSNKCPKTPNGEEGNCKLIKDCPQVFYLLTDFDAYKQFFCPVENKYAGVCCPKTTIQLYTINDQYLDVSFGTMYFKLALLTVLATLLLKSVVCAPGQVSFVVASTESSKSVKVEEDTKNDIPIIYEMDISSNVSNRFATTLIHSKVKNPDSSAKEATFSVVLPEKAFISKFVMEIGGKSYEAYVKGKEEAKDIYDKGVSGGQTAAHVSVSARHSNRFTVSINIEATAKAAFLLTYEELLERKNNQYELVLNIHPEQIVKDLNVQVNINETRSLLFVKTPSLRSGNEISKNDDKTTPLSTIEMKETSAVVKFHPDADQQKEFAKHLGQKESEGLAGQFIVQYEVERDPNGGEVLLKDGYFVHFFAPKDVEPLPKNVYFILDTSGSMWGLKLKNLKDAMTSILGEIKPDDTLSIIEFNSDAIVYNIEKETSVTVQFSNYEEPYGELSGKDMPGPVPATKEIIQKAKKLISKMEDTGSTYIIGGLEVGLYLVKREIEKSSSTDTKRQPIIIFLTDGQPNIGIYDTNRITELVTHLNKDKINVPVFSLSFGDGADKGFLRKLSLKNLGFSRHIYDDADASLQLQDFYKQISSPLLSNVNFKYDSEVKEVTKTNYPIFFEGSEIIVAGCYEDPKFRTKVDALGLKGPIILHPKIETPVTSLERLWAYLTVKEILEKREAADNKTELTKKALDLALKYSFVTDVSSLVVVKPNATSSVNTEDASKASQSFVNYAGHGKMILSAGRTFPVSALRSSDPVSSFQYDDLIAAVPSPYKPNTTQHPKIEIILPWLATVVNDNRTITLPEGLYELGEWSLNINTSNKCPKTPKGEEGNCKLIKDCPQVFSLLTDFDTYKQFFCPVENKYAGVCCPKTI